MAYKALYRTYRPANFEEIAGQEHITRTFKNALKNNKIAHAYLFSGPRGTGKTSIAKIIAKAVNCEKAPVENPCNECDICRGIDQNTISDVIEIDAASNNGVDEIREIRDKVKYLPGIGKYKVYIIDEVHMLSTGAFNALLKTLEEPPKHVIFILATTEPHKIPATIHSRCQRFDFRGVSVPEMIKRLHTIIDEEHININNEAIKVIAESAEGGMRDAISLLDQVVSYTDEKVEIDDVHAIKGTVSNEKLLTIAYAIYQNDSVEAIRLLEELILSGKEAPRLVGNMIKFYRDLLIFKNVDTSEDNQLIFEEERFKELSVKLSNNIIFFYIDVLNKAQNDMKWTNNAKLYMELALIKMVDKIEKQELVFEDEIEALQKTISALQFKVEDLEKREPIKEVRVEQKLPLETPKSLPKEEPIIEEKPEKKQPTTILDEERIVDDKPLYSEADVEEEQEVVEDNLFNLEPEPKEEKPYKTYDIRYVEDVLNNANREVKIQMIKKWFDIERFVTPKDMSYAKMITEGQLVATDGNMIIIQYSNASLCNRMMKPSIKDHIVSLLSDFYQKEINYVALPQNVWDEKSGEFIKKWRQNKEKNLDEWISLSEITHPDLKEIPTLNKEIGDMTPDSVKEAISIFGSDKVKVRKGE